MQSKLPTSLPIELFKDSHYAESYQCSICQQIPLPEMASNHAKCGAIFCKACLDSWLTRNKDCPNCRGRAAANLNKEDNRVVYQLHQKLLMRCPNNEQCEWNGQIGELHMHFKECVYIKMECKYAVAGCKFEGTLSELTEHEVEKKDDHLALCLITIHDMKGLASNKSKSPPKARDEEEKVSVVSPPMPSILLRQTKEEAKARIDRNVRNIMQQCNALAEVRERIKEESGSGYRRPAGHKKPSPHKPGPKEEEHADDMGLDLFSQCVPSSILSLFFK